MYYIGCSGWLYNHWQRPFYPDDLPKKDWLPYYASHFQTVEVNSTFYLSPSEKTVRGWYEKTPKDFLFTVKAHRYITHRKKLLDVKDAVAFFYQSLKPLKEKLGPILWQLPPRFTPDTDRLEHFLTLLNKKRINILEFRNALLFENAEVYDLAASYGVTVCTVIAPDLPTIWKKTTDILYVRFHGVDEWYSGKYSQKTLKNITDNIKEVKPRDAYIYFNNDEAGYATENVRMMEKILLRELDSNQRYPR